MTYLPPDLSSDVAVDRILASARKSIEEHGILGLRVAEVAKAAHSSLTQIYRYFGNRDGLLARVLGDIYEEHLEQNLAAMRERLFVHNELTIQKIVDALPAPTNSAHAYHQGIRLQILATAVTNEALHQRLSVITIQFVKKWNDCIDEARARMAPGTDFDERVFTIAFSMQMGYYRTLMGDAGFTEEEYRQYMADKLQP